MLLLLQVPPKSRLTPVGRTVLYGTQHTQLIERPADRKEEREWESGGPLSYKSRLLLVLYSRRSRERGCAEISVSGACVRLCATRKQKVGQWRRSCESWVRSGALSRSEMPSDVRVPV